VSRQPRARSASRGRQSPTPAKAPRAIRIDIDPVITAGFIHDRYDLLVRGRVVSEEPVEEVEIKLDDLVIGRVRYGEPEQNGDGGVSVFHVNVPLRRAEASATCACTVVARTEGGATHSERFSFAVDPSSPMPVVVTSGPTHSSGTHADVRPPIVLYVERAALDDGGQLLVHGWAIALSPVDAVEVFLDGERIGDAQLGGQRDDVGAAFPVYPSAGRSGFTLSEQIAGRAARPSSIRVQAVSASGTLHEAVLPVEEVHALQGRPTARSSPQPVTPLVSTALRQPSYRLVADFRLGPDLPSLLSPQFPLSPLVQTAARDPRREIRFFFDEMELGAEGRLSVSGWAVCAIGILTIDVYFDEQAIGEAELGLPRPDVGEGYRHIPMARYAGFRFDKTLGEVAPGEHRIRVVLRNGLDDEQDEVRTVLIAPPPPPAPEPTQFRIEIDSPTVIAGAVAEPITGRLTIEGWALARSGIAGIEVMLDDQRLGDAHYGLARQDVGMAFPDWVDSLRSGYAFHCPPRSLRNGGHVVQLTVRARSGDVLEHRFTINVRKSEEFEEGTTIRRRMTQVEADVCEDLLESLQHRPHFRLILRLNPQGDLEGLQGTIESLREQVYRDWRADILASDPDTARAARALVSEADEDLSSKIDVIGASDEAGLDRPIGGEGSPLRLVGCLSAGDYLGCDALLQIALASGLHREADMLYADEVRLSPVSREREPFFKPDFAPDLLLSTNYIGRPWFASTALLGRTGLTPRDLMRAGEYDAVLRCAEQAQHVHHVPSLLCLRGAQQIDDAELEAAALGGAAERRGIAAEVRPGTAPGAWRLRRTQPATGMVSIIIPTCAARGFIEACIKSLRERTAYRNFEIVCVDNIPNEQVAWKIWLRENADKVVPMAEAFNWSHFNNRGAEAASGEYLLFLNDDIEVTQPEWLDALLEHAQRPEVAVVGPQLLYPDNKVQHAGMFLAMRGIARHAFRFAAADDPGYFGLALTQRNVIAVTGACMLMRHSVYTALGGFVEAHEITNNDLDFCLRAHRAGKLIVFTPYASLLHHEAASRDRLKDVFDLGHFEARWSTLFAAGDPYFSPRLSRNSDDYRPDEEPVETIFAGHPLFRPADIKRILVVKVDHIGDFVTAIPAIRRLRQIFPSASIHVLASRAARALVELEDCVDEFIEFEFFRAISGLGPRQIDHEEYQALRNRLAPYRFDIAVDLRKHLDTRDVLRYTPARFLAGFDHMGQFPFLDIALEWEGDARLQRKRSHVADDLINLVEAIGTAGAADRTMLEAVATGTKLPESLPEEARALFERPVVVVHPGVGNVMRQWPAEHFAALIDLLAEKNGVNAILIGGAEEADLAQEVLERVANRDRVVSLVGKTSLRQLPDLLCACALYVGNNSGPKHIAAAFGVPTIGIHSGVVDATEWGPIGARAVALRRNMTCSPCYLARLEDCPRGFACMRGLDPAAVQETAELFLARPVAAPVGKPLIEASPKVVTRAAPPKRAAKPRRSRRRRMSTAPAD
jgi:ADP-heptose:LPS heptosyltransferase/GT2 family glycosyltransferase